MAEAWKDSFFSLYRRLKFSCKEKNIYPLSTHKRNTLKLNYFSTLRNLFAIMITTLSPMRICSTPKPGSKHYKMHSRKQCGKAISSWMLASLYVVVRQKRGELGEKVNWAKSNYNVRTHAKRHFNVVLRQSLEPWPGFNTAWFCVKSPHFGLNNG